MASPYDILEEEEQENPFLRPSPFPVNRPVPATLPELALPSTGLPPKEVVPEPPDPMASLPKGFTIDQPEAPETPEPGRALASLPEGFTIDKPEEPPAFGKKLEPDTEPAPEVKQSDWLDGINEVLRGASSEGVLMGMEGLYGMVEQKTKGTFLESLFKPAGEQRQAMTEMRERVRQGLPVDKDFAESTAGQVLEGIGQLTNIPLYAVPVVGTALGAGLSFGQLYQEAKEDYIQTQKAKGLPVDDAVADSAASKYMLGAGALEIAADKLILGKFLKAAKKSGLSVGDVLKTTGTMAASGAISEGGQEAVLNTVANTLEGYDPQRRFDENVYQSALVGGLIGGAGGVVAEAGGQLAGRAGQPAVAPAAVPPGAPAVVPPGATAGAAVPPAAVPGAPAPVVPPAATGVPPISPAQGQALQQAAVQAGNLPTSAGISITPGEAQGNLLKQAAAQAPTLIADPGQRNAALLGQAAEAATVRGQTLQGAEQARLLRQAALQVPGLPTQPAVTITDPVEDRLATVDRKLSVTTNPVLATELSKEKAVLQNKVETTQNVAVAKESATKAVAAGAPKTAQALLQSTQEVVTARDRVVHDAVNMAPEDLFAEEAPPAPTAPRRGEEGFAPPSGEVIGAPPSAAPVTLAVPGATPVPPTTGAAAQPAAAPAVSSAAPTTGLPPGITIIARDVTTGRPIYSGGIGNTITPPAVGMTVHGKGPTAAAHPGKITEIAPDLVLANGVRVPQVMVSWDGKAPVLMPASGLRLPPGAEPAVAEMEEVVIRPGIKGQEAVVQRPSAQIRQTLSGAKVNVEVFSTNGEKRLQTQDASTALMELKHDRMGLQLLQDCLLK